ncbi:hypothetical protein EN836_19335 [Mesorhizobium sp. M1C.F.Ca.ET.193.01.1.1]|uniref:hypothetical protein n=2 Tax=Mesorhizobium TaxID=68287 RepID=UPI000FD28F74|nr:MULTISPECIES: hypothetical protein [unclassified Mesorhizobium]TGS97408.1 hypothetical protein EN820_39425 [bacterium M00.F.Ca.ET.177.01.1.1]TGQ52578.1 hypothetical protein EN853_19330 [Mesorhizobium sp. M1C.F.Ca.ET.210.01.1.1]TGQ69200.1 hypothetical protein EN855_019340 [Mesorhizobium sp. M1C.F.Ca.ET.212.01.1.1]TGR05216.1 hypothetical protein EN847_19335 [Mesorhizobium sp. M1C.F.Ca.ET.204.01.1.1]TGR25821.1 hypothetical protein EN839_19335 [Mesorhizobium sp. M1C.F.Ca.ET.196.01.1.1]
MATESTKHTKRIPESLVSEARARRDFLKKAGRFAAMTPPAITLLLGTSLNSTAIAKSGGSRPGNGQGDKKHIHRGPPGQGYLSGRGQSDSYGGGSHGGSRAGDPN